MAHKTEQPAREGQSPRLPAGILLKPPVSLEELKSDTEHDPEGAEEFVTLIRALRSEGYRTDPF